MRDAMPSLAGFFFPGSWGKAPAAHTVRNSKRKKNPILEQIGGTLRSSESRSHSSSRASRGRVGSGQLLGSEKHERLQRDGDSRPLDRRQ
jgi:hypothetical protein